jgi:DNA mismatch repair protein MutH
MLVLGALGRVMVTYDKTSPESILEFAKRLTGKSLAELVDIPVEVMNKKNKGDLGTLLENFYFEHRPATNSGPDFEEAGVELKATGVVPHQARNHKAKERLVLTMINFEEIVHEEWETSTLLKKCQLMLVMFYLYQKHVEVIDRKFVVDPLLYRMYEWDIAQIKSDWKAIRAKVIAGKAHELSEGDTIYLGAARKGSGGPNEPLRKQPNSTIGAKARAFSFKPPYVDALISGEKVLPAVLDVSEEVSFEEAVRRRFSHYEGRTVAEIAASFALAKTSKSQKGFHRQLAVKMLAAGGNSVPELDRAGIELKTIRLGKNGKPRESMSFPGFKFLEILNEEWEDSSFFEKIEKKFLFVVFRPAESGDEIFHTSLLWNMPYSDRLEAQRVWEDTKRRVAIDATDLPGMTESSVAHVRPKGKDGNDKIPTPQGGLHLRQAFWLNARYIGSIINSR